MDDNTNTQFEQDLALLDEVTAAITEAGHVLLEKFSPGHRVADAAALLAASTINDVAATAVLRPALERLRPRARWDEDEEGHGALGAGEWWTPPRATSTMSTARRPGASPRPWSATTSPC